MSDLRVLADRIGNLEAVMGVRFDHVGAEVARLAPQ